MNKVYKVKGGILPPAILPLSGKHYILPWWKEVDSTVTLDDVEWTPDVFENKREDIQTFQSKSSPGISYTVRRVNGKLQCECPGYKYRNAQCKHVKAVQQNE